MLGRKNREGGGLKEHEVVHPLYGRFNTMVLQQGNGHICYSPLDTSDSGQSFDCDMLDIDGRVW